MDRNQPASIKMENLDDIIIDLTEDDEMEEQPLTDLQCRICFEKPQVPVATMCGHVFCMSCLTKALEVCENCPVCRQSRRFIRLFC